MNTHKWNNHKIQVETISKANRLFLIIEVRVTVDDKYTFSSTKASFRESIDFEVKDNEKTISCNLKTLGFLNNVISTKYELSIDNESLGIFRVRANNWLIPLLIWGTIGFLIFISL